MKAFNSIYLNFILPTRGGLMSKDKHTFAQLSGNFNFWNMFDLRGSKIIILCLSMISASAAIAQPTRNHNYDVEKKLHFGFSLIGNRADFKLVPSKDFYSMDTLKSVQVSPVSGFGLGMLVDQRLFEYGHVRILPSINFCQRNVVYTFKGGVKQPLKVESTYLDLPILFKLKSDRINDWRFYLIGGAKYSYDLQSKKNKNPSATDPTVPLTFHTYSYEFGAGFDFYFEYFKFSPEIKISNNVNNALVKNPLIYSQSLSRVYGQLIQISLHFE